MYFPKLRSCGIEGIMSQVVKEKTNFFFKGLKECNLKFPKIKNFDAMFLTNSVIKVIPVKYLDNVSFTITEELRSLVEYFSLSDKIKNDNLELS